MSLKLFGDFLYSHDLQFGFKKTVGCGHVVFVLRNVVDYFVSRSSTVNACSLDVHKAFDKVSHFILFQKLNVPVCLLQVLINWYSICSGVVRQNFSVSRLFLFVCVKVEFFHLLYLPSVLMI